MSSQPAFGWSLLQKAAKHLTNYSQSCVSFYDGIAGKFREFETKLSDQENLRRVSMMKCERVLIRFSACCVDGIAAAVGFWISQIGSRCSLDLCSRLPEPVPETLPNGRYVIEQRVVFEI